MLCSQSWYGDFCITLETGYTCTPNPYFVTPHTDKTCYPNYFWSKCSENSLGVGCMRCFNRNWYIIQPCIRRIFDLIDTKQLYLVIIWCLLSFWSNWPEKVVVILPLKISSLKQFILKQNRQMSIKQFHLMCTLLIWHAFVFILDLKIV